MGAPCAKRLGALIVILAAFLVAPVAAAVPVAALAPPDSSGAGIQAQISQLTAQVTTGATRIRQLSEQYDQAHSRADEASAQLAQAQADLAQTERQVSVSRARLAHQAVTAYVRDGSTSRLTVAITSSTSDLGLRQEYLDVASGDVSAAIAQLHLQETSLRDRQGALRSAEDQARRSLDAVGQARAAALAQASQEEADLEQARGRLASLQAEEAAQARAQAHAQAVARAQAQSQAQAQSAPPPPPATQGLPLAAGFRSVVTASVPPAAGSPPAPAPTGDPWTALRQCESGGDYSSNTGNGYFGAYQFSQATWSALGFPGRPDQASPSMQDQAAHQLQASSGWGQWPACAAVLGLI